ncbi:MAG: hypothetical protein IT581_06175 [Verrucomicrobiales bacterium]|nr:hypothetical protein [Verrucomicrobiales bacterium]
MGRRVSGWRVVVAIALAAGLPSRAFAQLPLARLTAVFPTGAQVGTSNLVTLQGSDLDGPGRLIFSDPKIQGQSVTNGPNQFLVAVPADQAPGIYDVRFAGRFGVSNPRAFAVDTVPELTLTADHRSTHQAFELPLDTWVNGRTAANARTWFRISLRAHQRCVFQTQTRAIDSRLEPVLALHAASGDELSRSRRGLLDFEPAADGVFLLAIHDVTFRGGDDFPFRLMAGTGPFVDAVSPGVLEPGTVQKVTLFGRQLPGGQPSARLGEDGRPLEQREVELHAPNADAFDGTAGWRPASATQPGFWWRWTIDGRSSNPIFFMSASRAVPRQSEPVETTLKPVTPPVDLWTRFGTRQRPGGVIFEGKKGDVWWVEVFSERLGCVVDAQIVVQRLARQSDGTTNLVDVADFQDQDANFGTPGFPTPTRDAAGRLELPEDGSYRVSIFDTFNPLPSQPRHPYRLVMRKPSPNFQLVAHAVAQPVADPNQRPAQIWTPFLRKGETLPLRVLAFRREGFDGEIEVSATGLPDGVTATATRLYSGQNTATLLLRARDDVSAWAGPVAIVGQSGSGDERQTRNAFASAILWNVADYNIEPVFSRPTHGLYAAVSGDESAPMVVSAGAGEPLEVDEGATIAVPLRVERRGEFNGELKLRTYGHPELEKLGELVVAANATNATLEIKLAERKLPVGKHTFYLQGLTQGKYRNQPEAVEWAAKELQAATETLKTVSAEDKPRAEAAKSAAEARKKAAEEKAQPRDVTVVVTSAPISIIVRPVSKS